MTLQKRTKRTQETKIYRRGNEIYINYKKIKLNKKNINEMPCMQTDTQNECNPNRQNKTYSNPNS